MISRIVIIISKINYILMRKIGKKGTALPGKIAMSLKPDILKDLSSNCDKIVIVTGTNGKTTTNNLANHVLSAQYPQIVSNLNGSNMLQGIISSFIIDNKPKYDWGLFEVDEGSMPNVCAYMLENFIILTNFFRDQLDRYGEVETTIKLVHDSIKNENTTLIMNADSPTCLYFDDLKNPKIYYSLEKSNFSKKEHTVAESIFCPKCGNKLDYESINYGNMGKYFCSKCHASNPKADYKISDVKIKNDTYEFTVSDKREICEIKLNLLGIYNLYNALGAISLARENNFSYDTIKKQIENFEYKRGRMETIKVGSSEVVLVLSKNPVGLSEVFSTIKHDKSKKSLMFIINDYPPDGKDISWIWDAYFKEVLNIENIDKFYCAGTRAEEIALRLKYVDFPQDKIEINHSKDQFDIKKVVSKLLNENDKTYIIATFTAMPEARKEIMKIKKNYEA